VQTSFVITTSLTDKAKSWQISCPLSEGKLHEALLVCVWLHAAAAVSFLRLLLHETAAVDIVGKHNSEAATEM